MSKVLSAARLASIVVAAVTAHAAFAAECPTRFRLDGFKTCADVAAAEKEGEVVLYTTSPDINKSPCWMRSIRLSPRSPQTMYVFRQAVSMPSCSLNVARDRISSM